MFPACSAWGLDKKRAKFNGRHCLSRDQIHAYKSYINIASSEEPGQTCDLGHVDNYRYRQNIGAPVLPGHGHRDKAHSSKVTGFKTMYIAAFTHLLAYLRIARDAPKNLLHILGAIGSDCES